MKKYLFTLTPLVVACLVGSLVAINLAQAGKAVFAKKTGSLRYYDAVKQLKATALQEQTALLGKTLPSAQHSLWLKMKKEIIDKELRKKAFIKDGELVVNHDELDVISSTLVARVKLLAQPHSKKSDRMIAIASAQSRAKDLLRRHSYNNAEHINSILRDAKAGIKLATTHGRIALSKLEELIIAAMERFEQAGKRDKIAISRLDAEVQVLRAIKKAKPSMTQEIAANTRMMDALNKQAAHDRITQKFVDGLIKEVVDIITKKTVDQKLTTKKTAKPKKEQKRGKDGYGKGRWGNLMRPQAVVN